MASHHSSTTLQLSELEALKPRSSSSDLRVVPGARLHRFQKTAMHTPIDLFSDEFWLRPADSLLLFQLLAVFHPQLAPVVQCLIDRSENDLL